MWPVNGIHSPLQRELYVRHRVSQAALCADRAGQTAGDILKEGAEKMRPRWKRGLVKEFYRAAAAKTLESKRPLSARRRHARHEAENLFRAAAEPGTVFALDPESSFRREPYFAVRHRCGTKPAAKTYQRRAA